MFHQRAMQASHFFHSLVEPSTQKGKSKITNGPCLKRKISQSSWVSMVYNINKISSSFF